MIRPSDLGAGSQKPQTNNRLPRARREVIRIPPSLSHCGGSIGEKRGVAVLAERPAGNIPKTPWGD